MESVKASDRWKYVNDFHRLTYFGMQSSTQVSGAVVSHRTEELKSKFLPTTEAPDNNAVPSIGKGFQARGFEITLQAIENDLRVLT